MLSHGQGLSRSFVQAVGLEGVQAGHIPEDKAYVYLALTSSPPSNWVKSDLALLLDPEGFEQNLGCWPCLGLGPNCRALYLERSHLEGYKAIYIVDSKENRFFLPLPFLLSLSSCSPCSPRPQSPSYGLSGSFSVGPESQVEHQGEQLCVPPSLWAQGISLLSQVTDQGLLSWQFLSQETLPALVSRTEKKIFFFRFYSPKSQAHKKGI